jgi:hypothetical protein
MIGAWIDEELVVHAPGSREGRIYGIPEALHKAGRL